MTLSVLLLTGIVAVLCVYANASNFGPMRGLLILVQLAIVLLRDTLLTVLIARQSRWLALGYLVLAAAAFLCLIASQHGYGNLPESAPLLAPIAAFGLPLFALLATHWRHPAAAILLASVALAAAYIDAHIVPQIVFANKVPPLPLPANAPLEAWRPYFMGAERERIIAVLKQRPTLEADLIAGLHSTGTLEILHTFDLIAALEPPATPALRAAFRDAQQRLAPLVTPKTESAWRIRSRQASEALGEPAP